MRVGGNMIEKTLKTTDGKLQVRIPTILNEIALGQMMAMQEKHYMDDLEAISILSGIPREELYTVTNIDDFQVFGDYVQSLAQQIKYLYDSDIVPNKVTFMLGKRKVVVNVIRNLSVEPAGAFLAARDIIADEINEHIKLYGEDGWQENFQPSLKACCQVLAHYFFCRATGKKYDEYEAEEFGEEIKKLRVTEALPIAKHFFSCYPDLLKQRIGFFQRLHQYWRRRQVFRRLKNLNT
ncbi:MAG: hypothetical protein JWP37_343 [Mucilaginibacter sp.]|nr:hypothetical protein [Mucilaginibacter sp.]